MPYTSGPPPILLLPRPPRPQAAGIKLPEARENLFTRLIRDPRHPNRPARERACTEMLCSLLINAPMARRELLTLLANRAGVSLDLIDDLSWEFDTELAVGSKRDDLRIEGWSRQNEDRQVILWTVEVKVAAPLHESSEQTADEDEDEIQLTVAPDAQTVSQIQNYDLWLSHQQADRRAGFVLAVADQTVNLPAQLQMRWSCLTWTELAIAIEDGLAADRIPPAESLFARHTCGFIRDHLWSDESMSKAHLDFDDVALLRAFAQIGPDCFKTVHKLVDGLDDVLTGALAGTYATVERSKTLVGQSNRSAVCVKILPAVKKGPVPPGLLAGIEKGQAAVWLECSPTSPARAVIGKLVQAFEPQLRERNPAWEVIDESDWAVLRLAKPLDWLLTTDDQQQALNDFVVSAVADLKQTGFLAALNNELSRLPS